MQTKRKLSCSIQESSDIPFNDQLRMIKDAGFEGFFVMYSKDEPVAELADEAAKLGMAFETIHAPFGGVNDLWDDNINSEDYYKFLLTRIDMCSALSVPICIMHVTVGNEGPPVGETGLNRFRRMCDYARGKNVRLAFENLEIPGHLDAVLSDITEYHGFCWDIGHNHCYTPDIDMMSRYSDRLICTHIHDNYGVTGETITYHDDLHLLPFDGDIDWAAECAKIKASPFTGSLMLEIDKIKAKDPRYADITMQEYISRAYQRALRLTELCK